MKIVVVSPNRKHLQDISGALQAAGHEVQCVEGGKSHLRSVAEQERPDLLLADGMCCDPVELTQVEYVTSHFPATAVVLMCSAHTPEFLLHSMRAGVREVLPSPAPADALHAAVQRIASKLAGPQPRAPGKVLAFMACKGGSGATFLATNLGWELAQDKSVLLIDMNLQFGDVLAFLQDGKGHSSVAEVAANVNRLDASFLAASTEKITPNFSVLAAPEDPTHAMEVKPEHIDAIVSIAVNHYDYVLLDMPRSIDPLAIRALDRATRVFAVLQASLPSIRNGRKLLEVFRSLGYSSDKTHLIVNRYERSGEIDLDDIRHSLHTAGRITTLADSWREVSASINHGEPLVKTARSNAVARQLIELAQSLNPKQEEQEQRSLLGRLFRRA